MIFVFVAHLILRMNLIQKLRSMIKYTIVYSIIQPKCEGTTCQLHQTNHKQAQMELTALYSVQVNMTKFYGNAWQQRGDMTKLIDDLIMLMTV